MALVLTTALTYLTFHIAEDDENVIMLGIGAAVTYLSSLALAMSIKTDNSRNCTNIKVWSILMFVIMLIVNMCFALLGVNQPLYITIMTALLTTHIFVVWKILQVKHI